MDHVIQFLNDHQFLNYKTYEPLAKHTYLKVGGEARLLFTPDDQSQLITTVQFLKKEDIPYKVIGKGSNLLFSDHLYDGVIIKNNKALNHQIFQKDHIIAGSSVSLVKLSIDLARAGLSGLEFIHGIPGSVGGGLYMNCGAYNKELKDVLDWVKILDHDGEVKLMDVSDCQYSYRSSIFKESGNPPIILEGKFRVEQGDPKDIHALMKKRRIRRQEAQPLDYPSCGSVFKNPEGTHAWIYIDQAGLRGYRIGGAQFSEKHCNFIINDQNAKAQDIKDLIDLAEQRVYETTGIQLQREVEYYNF